MDTILLASLSLVALTGLAWLARAVAKARVCPICAGVSATWAWLLVARAMGVAVDPVPLALLIGGSAVGGADWIASRLPAGRSPALWKTLAIPAGFVAAYGVASERWRAAAVGMALIVVLLAMFLRQRAARPADPAALAGLEERMKRCC